MPHIFLQQAYEGKGDFPSAINEWRKVGLAFGVKPEHLSARENTLRRAFASKGLQGYWQTQLDFLKADSKTPPFNNYNFATLYARVGDRERSFLFLEKALQEHSQDLTLWLLTEPAYDSLRSDPRYRDLLRRMRRVS
jgi:hypothetical protein